MKRQQGQGPDAKLELTFEYGFAEAWKGIWKNKGWRITRAGSKLQQKENASSVFSIALESEDKPGRGEGGKKIMKTDKITYD